MPDLTLTIPGAVIIGYFAIGASLWLPLEVIAWRRTNRPDREPFMQGLWRGFRRRPYVPLAVTVAWPWAMWEAIPLRWLNRR